MFNIHSFFVQIYSSSSVQKSQQMLRENKTVLAQSRKSVMVCNSDKNNH